MFSYSFSGCTQAAVKADLVIAREKHEAAKGEYARILAEYDGVVTAQQHSAHEIAVLQASVREAGHTEASLNASIDSLKQIIENQKVRVGVFSSTIYCDYHRNTFKQTIEFWHSIVLMCALFFVYCFVHA